MKRIPFLSGGILVTMAVTVSAGCGTGTGPVQAATTASTATAADTPAIAPITTAPGPAAQASAAPLPTVLVHKSPSCGCCGAWIEHIRKAGFRVEIDEREDLEPVRARLGIPRAKAACHTAEVAGYVVEGHVPAEDIKRLLSEKPKARGLTVPGMPIGSPGMESPDGRVEPYVVELIATDGRAHPYARHGGGA